MQKEAKLRVWLAIESLKKNNAHAIVSAGNTGALFLISKLNLKMIENIDKPAFIRTMAKQEQNECLS